MKKIILYDSDCIMCTSWVHFIHVRDVQKELFFCNLFSERGQQLIKENDVELTSDAIVFIVDGKTYIATEAIIKILEEIHYSIAAFLLKLCPLCLTNFVYKIVAKHRRKISFNSCVYSKTLHQNIIG